MEDTQPRDGARESLVRPRRNAAKRYLHRTAMARQEAAAMAGDANIKSASAQLEVGAYNQALASRAMRRSA